MQSRLTFLFLTVALFTAGSLAVIAASESSQLPPEIGKSRPSDDRASDTAILDATQFRNDHNAFLAYTVAAQVETTLSDVRCYCPCSSIGHRTLRYCFASLHGSLCLLCQKEAVYCYLERRKGKSSEQIRKALTEPKARHLGLAKQMKRLYFELTSKGQAGKQELQLAEK